MANSEDPDEMPHKVAFHQGLHCLLLKINLIYRERNTIFGNDNQVTCNPSIYTMDHPDLTVSNFMENWSQKG